MRLVVLAAIAIGQVAAATLPSCDVLSGWTQSGVSRLYEGDNLYEYMDGNSEGYLIYGFVRMRGVTCVKGSEKVLIDISEMQDSESAYGLFSSNRDVNLPVEPIGANGQVVPRKAIFVKDKYFVEIAAEALIQTKTQLLHTPRKRHAIAKPEAEIYETTELFRNPQVVWLHG